MMEEKIPKTLDEAIDYLLKCGTDVQLPGRVMRNEWGLWEGSDLAQWFYKREIYHADDMSGIIVDSYQKVLVDEPIDLEEQIKHYHAHWEVAYGKDHLKIMKGHVKEHINEDNVDVKWKIKS